VVDLLEQQTALQQQAALVLEDLGLLSLLENVGRPVQVGSVALGLMVARDIDVTTLCRQFDLDHLESLAPRLTDENRLAILTIKDAWHGHPDYSSYAIYAAALDHGVRTPDEFGAYLKRGRRD
jgi:hypothetical protein